MDKVGCKIQCQTKWPRFLRGLFHCALSFCLGAVCWHSALSQAAVIRINSLNEIFPHLQSGDLIFFDIDDTLICYPSHLGSEPWFQEAKAKLNAQEFHQIAGFLAEHLQVTSVEPDTRAVLGQLRKAGHTLFGITSREMSHPAVADWPGKTVAQLASIGVRFEPPDLELPFIVGGVIFTGWGLKGPVLQQFLGHLGQQGRFVLIDDRFSDLEQVDALAAQSGRSFLGFWYCAVEPRRKQYDASAAEVELSLLRLGSAGPDRPEQ